MNFLQVVLMKSQWSLMFIVCEFSSTMTYLGADCFVTMNLGIVKFMLFCESTDLKSLCDKITFFTDFPLQNAWCLDETDIPVIRGSKSSKTPYRNLIHWFEIIFPSCEELVGARKEYGR